MDDMGYKTKATKTQILVGRKTRETTVGVKLKWKRGEAPLEIETGIPFLDHMIETIAWRSEFNIGVTYESDTGLAHPACEDIGTTLGYAFLTLYKDRMKNGVHGNGYAVGIIDEARADVAISMEGRANSFIRGEWYEQVESMNGNDLKAFIEGFSQGMKCTIHVNFKDGNDPHHSWEAAFRAFGEALLQVFKDDPWRAGSVPGVKGTIE